MFSKKLEYGYLIMKTLKNTSKTNMISGKDIIKKANIPLNMGLSILSELSNGGLIYSVKGKKGGFYRNSQEISLFQLFFILENNIIKLQKVSNSEYQNEIMKIAIVVLNKMKEVKV